MPDPHFITRELDRRIALAKAAHDRGEVAAGAANRALLPWAAAEAWLVGHRGDAISPRPPHHSANDLCPLDTTLAELTRARDTLARQLIRQIDAGLAHRWKGLCTAVRDLERLRSLRKGFRQMRPAALAQPAMLPSASPTLPPSQPSLLADMFAPDGKPLPIDRRAA